MINYLDFKNARCKDCYKCLRACPVNSIRFENRDYVDKKIKLSDKPLVGSGGTEYIKFKAVKEGKATVTFEYGQHWDGG